MNVDSVDARMMTRCQQLCSWLLLGMATLTQAAAGTGWEAIKMSDQQRSSVVQAVLFRLKDPDSAKFRDIAAAKLDGGAVMVCGSVNSRNGFGGYGGFAPFAVEIQGGKAVLQGIAENAAGAEFLRRRCAAVFEAQ